MRHAFSTAAASAAAFCLPPTLVCATGTRSLNDLKGEIDFAFVAVQLETAQSDFYRQHVIDYTNEANVSVSNTFQTMPTCTFDWQPDHLSRAVDGIVRRTLHEHIAWNATDTQYNRPQSGYTHIGNKSYHSTSMHGTKGTVATDDNCTEPALFYATGNQRDRDPHNRSPQSSFATVTNVLVVVTDLSGNGNQDLQGQILEAATTAVVEPKKDAAQSPIRRNPSSEAATIVAGSGLALLGFLFAALML